MLYMVRAFPVAWLGHGFYFARVAEWFVSDLNIWYTRAKAYPWAGVYVILRVCGSLGESKYL